MTLKENGPRLQDILELLDKEVRLQLISRLIEKDTAALEELKTQAEVKRKRLKILSDLLDRYSSEEPEKDSESVSEKVKVSKEDSVSVPEEQSAQGTFPNRMRRSYKQLLLWIAEAPSGRAWDEIVRYCAENHDMDERRISFFVANYRSVRYGLLKTSNGTVSITPRGMMYLRREGLLKDDEMNA